MVIKSLFKKKKIIFLLFLFVYYKKGVKSDQSGNLETKEIVSSRKQTFKERVVTKTSLIMKSLNDINAMKARLRKDYVPSVVISNLNQTMKDLDVCFYLLVILN